MGWASTPKSIWNRSSGKLLPAQSISTCLWKQNTTPWFGPPWGVWFPWCVHVACCTWLKSKYYLLATTSNQIACQSSGSFCAHQLHLQPPCNTLWPQRRTRIAESHLPATTSLVLYQSHVYIYDYMIIIGFTAYILLVQVCLHLHALNWYILGTLSHLHFAFENKYK